MEPMAIYGKSRIKTNTNLSRSISLSILDENGNEIPFQTSDSTTIEFLIPRDPNLQIPPMISTNQSFHYLNLTSDLAISIHFEINANFSYLFIYKFDQFPIYNSSMHRVDGWILVNESHFTYMIDNQRTLDHQFLIFGLQKQNSNISSYEYRIYSSGCYYLNKENQWKDDGLIVGRLTNLSQTHCCSTHLTTFAGGLQIFPPSIDFNFVFANADFQRNKTIYSTVICVTMIYIILIIYARRQDRKDLQKLGITPLSDNHRDDHYYYQLIVFTGQRINAGTESNVHFVLGGDRDQTYVRTFTTPNRKIFQRGDINAFVMSVPRCLGPLNYLHIWHDNSGQGSMASWFLKQILVRDLQTMETFYFITQRWFGVEKDDGKIERLLPVAGELEKENFSYLLSKKTYSKMSDDHLWFSIFSRPLSNQFTRVQRCTCCFVLFFLSMLFNILYYDLNKQNQSTGTISLTFGPLFIPLQQIITGILVEVFSLLISLFLVQFFRRIRPHRVSPHNQMKRSKSRLMFPRWCIFIAYGISFLLILTSIFLIIARGIEFGDEKSREWLTSILSGFFSSLFLSQPLKIFALAIFFTFFFRNRTNDEEFLDANPIELKSDKKYLHSTLPSAHQLRLYADRLTKKQLAYVRLERMRDVHMWSILSEVFSYICFFIVLCLIVYPNRNENGFHQVRHLRKLFSFEEKLSKVSTTDQYWNWLENDFTGNIRAKKWYNSDIPKNLTGFIDDKTNRLIGWAKMRQLKVDSRLSFEFRGSLSNLRSNISHLRQLKWINN